MKRIFGSIVHRWQSIMAVAISLLVVMTGVVSAQETHYTDVPVGAWYEGSAAALLRSGALDETEARLRPNDLATRAEVLKLLVNVYGEDLIYPAQASFNDVSRTAWYFPYIETSAHVGWIKGDGNCYGTDVATCTARPAANVNRAEMAMLLQRAFDLPHLNFAPVFPDNSDSGTWYFAPIQTAADHCILQGDNFTGLVRPAASMNRAEMIVMFDRASQQQRYGQECAEPVAQIQSITTPSANKVRLSYNVDLDPGRIGMLSRYSLEQNGGDSINIRSITVVDARNVELETSTFLRSSVTYRLKVTNMLTEGGRLFNDSRTFTYTGVSIEPTIDSVTVRASDLLRVRFSEDINRSFANDEERYSLRRTSGFGAIGIDHATIIDDRTVEIDLAGPLSSNTNYRLSVTNMRTKGGVSFNDTATFKMSTTSSETIDKVVVRDNNLLRVIFSEDIDRNEIDKLPHYILERLSGGGKIDINRVIVVDGRTVDLSLQSSLATSTTYVLRVENMKTKDGKIFNDSIIFASTVSMIEDVTPVSSRRLRLAFNTNLERIRAEDESRYEVRGLNGTLRIGLATLVETDSVELVLDEAMRNGEEYTVTVTSLRTMAGATFSDKENTIYLETNIGFKASLSGTNEVPAVSTATSGTGTFTLTKEGLQYDITLRNFNVGSITASHFHRGSVSMNGPVLEPITITGLRTTGIWTNLTAEERVNLLDGNVYVNVHTNSYPDGEIRGQVLQ